LLRAEALAPHLEPAVIPVPICVVVLRSPAGYLSASDPSRRPLGGGLLGRLEKPFHEFFPSPYRGCALPLAVNSALLLRALAFPSAVPTQLFVPLLISWPSLRHRRGDQQIPPPLLLAPLPALPLQAFSSRLQAVLGGASRCPFRRMPG